MDWRSARCNLLSFVFVMMQVEGCTVKVYDMYSSVSSVNMVLSNVL